MPGIGVVFGRYSANTLQHNCAIGAACPIWGLTQKKKVKHMDAAGDAAADLLQSHPPGEHADNSLKQS